MEKVIIFLLLCHVRFIALLYHHYRIPPFFPSCGPFSLSLWTVFQVNIYCWKSANYGSFSDNLSAPVCHLNLQ